jgi:asparagine synthase (glutamine-hydrolysing)
MLSAALREHRPWPSCSARSVFVGENRVVSGILALIRTDGAPTDPRLIQSLTNLLAFRGPDKETLRCDGPAALGHALLRTSHGPGSDRQPLTLDDATWIVADARVDARADLAAQLGPSEGTLASAPDAELILRAYLTWGEECVDHLLGDYAFAVWDRQARRFFCARDHMGVKPLYYAHVGPWLLVSSAIECIRGHPAVSNRLDDLAIADFLLFGFGQDPAATSFGDIRRLPAAHRLTWSAKGLDVRRYWTLPIEEPVYYRRDGEYTDRFVDLLREAVNDRLRIDRVSIFMSGGIDSPALAATAAVALGQPTGADSVRAFTFVYESLIEDSERQFAAMAAEQLRIPIQYCVLDEACGCPPPNESHTPEPFAALYGRDTERRCYADMAAHSRVAFYGEGPDNALCYEWMAYLSYLWRRRRVGRLVGDFGRFLVHHRRVPLFSTIPRLITTRLGRPEHEPVFPEWMATDLVHRFHLRDRWREGKRTPESLHPVRPVAHASFQSPLWQSVFETLEPSYTGVPLEVRHPYVDIRLLRFMLSVPVVPWCRQKQLLRRALRGVVPETVRRRPKAPLGGNPDYERVRRDGLPAARPSERLATYGAADMLSQAPLGTVATVEAKLRFVALSRWLYDLEA